MTNESFEKALKLLREEQHNFIQKLDELEKETATVKTALQLIEEDLAAVDAAHVIFQRIGALGPDPDPEPPQAADDRLDDSSQLKSFDDPATPTKMDRNGDGDLRDLSQRNQSDAVVGALDPTIRLAGSLRTRGGQTFLGDWMDWLGTVRSILQFPKSWDYDRGSRADRALITPDRP